jgi:predicted TIM-barrel fold metal-dependent hydrolase
MLKIINAHCHLLNYQFISPTCFRSRSAILAMLMKHHGSRPIVRTVAAMMPKRKFHRLHEMYDLMETDISHVADTLRLEMEQAGIQLAVPMVVDLGRAAFTENPRIPFTFQVKLVSDISLKHFGAMMPFVMVDPRRPRAADLLIRCLEELGFIGVKMYPALGYHPDPSSIYNEPQTNDELNKMYAYCQSRCVPMTTHCSPGGAYSDDILRLRTVRAEVTNPWVWKGVLQQYPNLYLNFAHFGQDLIRTNEPKSWANGIRDLMRSYPNVYSDVAYNEHALMPHTRSQYFDALNRLIDKDSVARDRVLFGTDWIMTRHTWREIDYVSHFRKGLDEDKLQKIAVENSLNFLFPGRRFPDRVACFLKANGRSVSELPKWLLSNLDIERIGE